MIGFQGCQAGLTALRLADHLCRARPGAVALIVCVELCTIHFQLAATEENLLAGSLFSDGASAALVVGPEAAAVVSSNPALHILQTGTLLKPGSGQEMIWRLSDHGFVLHLSPDVPAHLKEEVGRFLEGGLGVQPSTNGDEMARLGEAAGLWAVHPGGAAILQGIEHALELDPNALAASRRILRDFGNMSSPTIYFVLGEILDDRAASGPGVALAFGPGLSIEGFRFFKRVAR